MLLQRGVKGRTKHAVSLGARAAWGSAFYTPSAGFSTVQRTVNTKTVLVRILFLVFVLDWHFADDLKTGFL